MTMIGLVTTCQLLIAGERRALCGRQHLILCLAPTAERSNKITSVYCLTQIPTVTLLGGSPPWPFLRGHATTLPLEGSLAYGQAETALGKGCNMIPCLPNSISEFRMAVTMPKLNFELRP